MHKDLYRISCAQRSDEHSWIVELPGGWRRRLKGLIGRPQLASMTGIWLLPCNGIHTFGMRASIDVVVLDREYKVLRVIPALCPNRIVWPLRSGHSTLELAPGSFEAIAIMAGDILEVEGAHDV